MISEQDYILINKYLDKQLTEKELQFFEGRLSKEDALLQELKVVQSMNSYLDRKDDLAFMLQQSKAIGDNYQPKIIPLYKRKKTILTIAASFILIITSIVLFNISTSPYQQFAEHRKLSIEKAEPDEVLNQAIAKFNNEYYKEALPILKKINDAEIKKPEFILAEGICYLELNQLNEAQNVFENLIQTEQIYQDDGYWYLALTAFRKKEYPESKEFLSKISASSPYQKQIQKLLPMLKK